MKRKYLYLCIFSLILSTTIFSQKLKYGYIDANKILLEMPDIAIANQNLEKEATEIQTFINTRTKEYQTKLEEYQKSEASTGNIIKEEKKRDLDKLASDISQFQQNAQNVLNKKKQDLYKPAIGKLKDAIAAVARANGFRFIIDNSNGQLLYCEEGDNVENLVRKQLGIAEK